MAFSFGERLKSARISKKLTQKELALKIGAKHNSISDWENNKNKPDPDTIELLCGVLEISPNYLLGSFSSDTFTPEENTLIKKYRKLDGFGKEVVDYILDKEYERSTGEYVEFAARGGKIKLDKETAAKLAKSADEAPNSSQDRDVF